MKLLILLITLLATFHTAYCASDSMANRIISNMVSINNKPVNIGVHDSSIYVIATKRNCVRCFEDICAFYHDSNRAVYIVVFMEKDVLAMLPNYSTYSSIASCIKDVYFFWTTSVKDHELLTAIYEPSPQMIIQDKDRVEYKSYSEFLQLVEKK